MHTHSQQDTLHATPTVGTPAATVEATPAERTPAARMSTSSRAIHTKQHRLASLDAIRAIACIAVLVYHFIPGLLPGGFLGVDVFFMLSGFLITALLVKEQQSTGRINLVRFYVRRFRRIVPALGFMTLVVTPLALLINTDLLVGIGKQLLGVWFASYNWFEIAAGSDYFNQSNPHLFMNIWSLSIEEQFYLIWPIVLVVIMLAYRGTSLRRAAWIPAALGCISVALMALYTVEQHDVFNPSPAYMSSIKHGFSLMFGSALGLWMRAPFQQQARKSGASRLGALRHFLQGVFGWLGLAGLLASFVLVSDSARMTYPWMMALSCLCTLALIAAGTRSSAMTSHATQPLRALHALLGMGVLQWVGQRSYGLYIWHWPVLVLFETAFPQIPLQVSALIEAAITVVITECSYRFVEQPILRYGLAACVRRLFQHLRSFSTHAVRSAAILLVLLVCVPTSAYAVAHAPEKTSVQLLLEQAQAMGEQGDTPNNHDKTDGNQAQGDQAQGDQAQGGKDQRNADANQQSSDDQNSRNQSSGDQNSGDQTQGQRKAADQSSNTSQQAPAQQVWATPLNAGHLEGTTIMRGAQPPLPNQPAPITGDQVLVIGDSVTLGSKWYIEQALPGVVVDGKVSRAIVQAPALIRDYQQNIGQRPFVVISLNTNAVVTAENIAQIRQAAGPNTRIVFVTGFGPARCTWIPVANQAVMQAAQEDPLHIRIADWASAISPHQDWLAADFFHPGGEQAFQLYVQTITNALNTF